MSENRGDEGSPRSLEAGTPSGRPPDVLLGAVASNVVTDSNCMLVQQVQSDSLERPRSPLSLDSQGQCKKLRGTGVHDPMEVLDAMEMEGVQRERANPVTAMFESEGQKFEISVEYGGSRMSYATAVNGSGRRSLQEQPGVEGTGGDPNKISETCGKSEDRVQEATDRVVHNESGERSTGGTNGNGELFGPWMMVDTRRKRANNEGPVSVKGMSKAEVRAGANRFADLGEEQVELMEEQGTVDNAASGLLSPNSGQPRTTSEDGRVSVSKAGSSSVSNSAKGSSEASRVLEKAVVLPMVEGQQVSVVEHAQVGGGKGHAAISLLEKGHGRSGVEGIVLGKVRGGKRSGREVSHQGLRVRKPPDMKTVSRAVLNEWVEEEGELVPVHSVPAKPDSRDPVHGVDSGDVMEGSNGDC
ncbi:hypothetical protein V6N11_054935 [Hibiscus sabdariffa]|uniref:Uncharacterized protein n=1 Tax=Hibiscus sabdariffa TaxID=183260 RepID=A0ABR2P456_9ROSI